MATMPTGNRFSGSEHWNRVFQYPNRTRAPGYTFQALVFIDKWQCFPEKEAFYSLKKLHFCYVYKISFVIIGLHDHIFFSG